MKIVTALTMLAVGAILAFAVRANPPGLNIHTVGWVIMLTGVAGMALPGPASGWLRRRIVVRRGPVGPAAPAGSAGPAWPAVGDDDAGDAGDAGGTPYPPYLLRDPAAVASAILQDAELAGAAADQQQAPPAAATVRRLTAVRLHDDDAAGEAGPAGTLDDLLAGRAADDRGGRP
jgi:hypothetical protein